MEPIRQKGFRGVSEADATRQAEADATQARASGYEPVSQQWSTEAGLHVLTVTYGPSGQPAISPAPTGAFSLRAPQWAAIAAIGGVVVIAGAFLPWISLSAAFVGTVSRSGIDGGGDGLIAVAVGALIAIAGFVGATSTRPVAGVLVVLGVVAVVLALFEGRSVGEKVQDIQNASNLVSVGIGIWAVGIGGITTLVAAVRMSRSP